MSLQVPGSPKLRACRRKPAPWAATPDPARTPALRPQVYYCLRNGWAEPARRAADRAHDAVVSSRLGEGGFKAALEEWARQGGRVSEKWVRRRALPQPVCLCVSCVCVPFCPCVHLQVRMCVGRSGEGAAGGKGWQVSGWWGLLW